jgi:hypothetical protein
VLDLNILLKDYSLAKGLEFSFSKVKYSKIAQFVGLDPSQRLRDAPTLKMHRARIPNFLFKKIIKDFDIMAKVYAPSDREATFDFLAPASVYIFMLFL